MGPDGFSVGPTPYLKKFDNYKISSKILQMTTEVVKPDGIERAVSIRPVRGQIGNREVIVTRGGKLLIDGEEVKGGPLALMQSLGINDEIPGDDELSKKQWNWTQRLLGQVAGMILGTDRATAMALTTGEMKIEDVVERASALVEKIMDVQIGYERGRLQVSHLDTAQATAEAMSMVLRTAATNWWRWKDVPQEMKDVVVGVLEDYRRAQAVIMAAEMPQEMMERGLGNIKAIAQAKTDAEVGYKKGILAVEKQKKADQVEHVRAKGQAEAAVAQAKAVAEKARLQGVVDVAAGAVSRSGKGVADVLLYHGTQLTAFVMDKDKGLVPMTGEGLQAFLDKIKEPKVWCGAGGVTASIVGTTMVITAVGLASGPLAMVTVPLVLISAGIAGAGLGAKVPDWVRRKFGGETDVDSE